MTRLSSPATSDLASSFWTCTLRVARKLGVTSSRKLSQHGWLVPSRAIGLEQEIALTWLKTPAECQGDRKPTRKTSGATPAAADG